MATNFWTTHATRDLERARTFYTGLGFTVRSMPGGAPGIVVQPDESSMLCLFAQDAFRTMIPGEPCDPARAQEVVYSVSRGSKQAVDELVRKAVAAGGQSLGEPKEQPYGYGGGFRDPDGHVWAVLWLAQG